MKKTDRSFYQLFFIISNPMFYLYKKYFLFNRNSTVVDSISYIRVLLIIKLPI